MELNKTLDALKPFAEELAKKNEAYLNGKVDQAIDFLLAKLTDLIPGNLDNALVESKKAAWKEEVHKLLHDKIEQIS